MPKLLHDLANALTVASLAGRGEDGAVTESVYHALSLVGHMRTLYLPAQECADATLDLSELLLNITPMLEVAATPSSLLIECSQRLRVCGERWRLESVLLNLVLNAAEHAANICVRASCPTDAAVEITVEDDGPGFPPEILARTTEPGASLHGYGVPSVRRQVAIIGGRTQFERGPAGGALVRVSLRPAPGPVRTGSG